MSPIALSEAAAAMVTSSTALPTRLLAQSFGTRDGQRWRVEILCAERCDTA